MGSDPLIGTMAGNYKLVERLGAGGMGEVYKAEHPTIGSKVAIKLLHAIAAREPGIQERFLREAQAVNRIDHEGIVKVIDAGRLGNGRPFLVMELLQGESLQQIKKRARMPIEQACKVMIDVLDAVDAAHRAGVVHRDLKPPNVFHTKSGRTIVLDFGIAKLMGPDSSLRLTMTGMAVGTPHYMAPEQIRGKQITPAVDIYAAGVMLFELACGRHPFEGDNDESIFEGHLVKRPPPPRALEPSVPIGVQDVILKALAKEPDKRFASAAAMRDALRAAIGTAAQPIAALPGAALPGAAPPAAAPARNPWARPTGYTPPGSRSPDDVVTVGPPAQIPDTQRGGTPVAVVAHRERSRLRWIIAAGAATIVAVVGVVFATSDRGESPREQAQPVQGSAMDADAPKVSAPPVEAKPVEAKPVETAAPAPSAPDPAPVKKVSPTKRATTASKPSANKPSVDPHAPVDPFDDAPVLKPAPGHSGAKKPPPPKARPKDRDGVENPFSKAKTCDTCIERPD